MPFTTAYRLITTTNRKGHWGFTGKPARQHTFRASFYHYPDKTCWALSLYPKDGAFDDVMIWTYFLNYWPFTHRINQLPVSCTYLFLSSLLSLLLSSLSSVVEMLFLSTLLLFYCHNHHNYHYHDHHQYEYCYHYNFHHCCCWYHNYCFIIIINIIFVKTNPFWIFSATDADNWRQ